MEQTLETRKCAISAAMMDIYSLLLHDIAN